MGYWKTVAQVCFSYIFGCGILLVIGYGGLPYFCLYVGAVTVILYRFSHKPIQPDQHDSKLTIERWDRAIDRYIVEVKSRE